MWFNIRFWNRQLFHASSQFIVNSILTPPVYLSSPSSRVDPAVPSSFGAAFNCWLENSGKTPAWVVVGHRWTSTHSSLLHWQVPCLSLASQQQQHKQQQSKAAAYSHATGFHHPSSALSCVGRQCQFESEDSCLSMLTKWKQEQCCNKECYHQWCHWSHDAGQSCCCQLNFDWLLLWRHCQHSIFSGDNSHGSSDGELSACVAREMEDLKKRWGEKMMTEGDGFVVGGRGGGSVRRDRGDECSTHL